MPVSTAAAALLAPDEQPRPYFIKKAGIHTLTYHEATEEEKAVISGWQYDGEYAIYNMPSYDEQKRQDRAFANPVNRLTSFYDGETLVGFVNLSEEETEVFFGIGVAPDCCGKGYGQQMTRTACALSKARYPGKPLYLEVRTWNARAVRCYEKAGFRITGSPIRQTPRIGDGLFYHMVCNP